MKMRLTPIQIRLIFLSMLTGLLLAGCGMAGQSAREACSVTEPTWLTPPEDSAVMSEPTPAYYLTNGDASILAGAWWWDLEDHAIPFDEQGIKIGWFRPEGVELTITGERLDGDAGPLRAQVPCCYPTRFQASGLTFPTPGCWEITATAADSELAFTVWVAPVDE